jgi:hypothetical protein
MLPTLEQDLKSSFFNVAGVLHCISSSIMNKAFAINYLYKYKVYQWLLQFFLGEEASRENRQSLVFV